MNQDSSARDSLVLPSRVLPFRKRMAFEMVDDFEDAKSDSGTDTRPLIGRRATRSWSPLWLFRRNQLFQPRQIYFEGPGVNVDPIRFPPNYVHNQKYSVLTFLPKVLFEQFRFFFNLYFLCVAMSQFIPPLKIGFLFTHISPLAFVLSITMMKEAYDDFQRYRRDKEANSQMYEILVPEGTKMVPSSALKVGDIVILHSEDRVPADLLLLRTRDDSGSVFIKTDQLDGETDWKLRKAVSFFQSLPNEASIWDVQGYFNVEAPKKEIYDFAGNFTPARFDFDSDHHAQESLSLENTLWSSTVVTSGSILGLVIFTGKETRTVMNANRPPSKVGQTDLELNNLSKILFTLTIILAGSMIVLKGFHGPWVVYFFRFVLLFSAIVPISLRVNLDLAKTHYSIKMMKDKKISETIVRSSTIPEELGRISYLFTDKTGTLTQNVMEFKKLQLRPPLVFDRDGMDNLREKLKLSFLMEYESKEDAVKNINVDRKDHENLSKLLKIARAMAICHNVTPVMDDVSRERVYQAASPDEVALVKFCETIKLELTERTEEKIVLRTPTGLVEEYEVLNIFPFTSETKRMGIIVRHKETSRITFYMKGAESVLGPMVELNDWLDEEVEGLAREGLRTLVFASRSLTDEQYAEFKKHFSHANALLKDRQKQVRRVINSIEENLELLGLSGVEDKLQDGVKNCLENLRNAGVKVWMLTGDKDETAKCIARSARLVDRTQEIFPVIVRNKRDAERRLDQFGGKEGSALLIDGPSLTVCLEHLGNLFFELACQAPAVICCRCSPTQKAEVVELIKSSTGKRCCAIGDGGNDVSMIQAAHVGVGIVGKEGKQASLAADFSITQFSHLQRLILWHGRNSYKRTARLSQFIMHRGVIISIIQAVFSALFFFAAVPIFSGYLMVGYATIFTFLPVFSLVYDEDVSENLVNLYPELYHELQKGRPLSFKTFFIWMLQSVWQGGAIMILSIYLFQERFVNVVAITFTSLILSELLNVAIEIQKWKKIMILSELFSVLCYFTSMALLKSYFGKLVRKIPYVSASIC